MLNDFHAGMDISKWTHTLCRLELEAQNSVSVANVDT